MNKERSVKQRLIAAVLTLVMLVTSLLGTTYAWFTDSVTSSGNKIQAGTLKVDLELLNKTTKIWKSIKTDNDPLFDYDNWEPGYVDVKVLKVENEGSLALKWKAMFVSDEKLSDLAKVIDVYVCAWGVGDGADAKYPASRDLVKEGYKKVGTVEEFVNTIEMTTYGNLKAGESAYLGIALKMQETAGNEYQNLSLGDFDIKIVATQMSHESDSYGSDYDKDATFPELKFEGITVDVTTDENNTVTSDAIVSGEGVSATIPTGVTVNNGVTKLALSVTEKAQSEANLTLNDGEALRSLDVHMEGVSEDNAVPMLITIEQAMKTGLNIGNYTLYHVENGTSNAMTSVSTLADLDSHNEFYYDPATGDVTLALATFSEVAMVAEESGWEGGVDHSWYTEVIKEDADAKDFVIANADQLWSFSQIVGGMATGIKQDSFSGKTVTLVNDINIGDTNDYYDDASENGIVFYPIGYYNSEGTYEKTNTAISSGFYTFEGTFDGNGHTIANFYQNTWEMKGDHNWYDATEQRYRDGMGLFGKVYGGTVKNLTVSNFSSDGEITTTGVIAAYADGATFENIAIFNCNPRVYNIGNGGIVGCVGWYAKEADLKTTFTNITVDNSNKISALWGSWDVACGGIVGQYYPTSGQSSAGTPANAGIHFENCHVSAQIDVYNDVCANYQYYAYRYAGMLIGSVRENETIDGHSYPKMDGITASDCTVHFGTWNDYYYCELVANTTASYTHDYQMSRLTEIKAISGTTITYLDGTIGTVPTSGRANYVIVDYTKGHGTDNATCYHFVNGVQHFHDVADSDNKEIYETVNGVQTLKEDKQHLYLEFNNLVTGYGWGVTSRGLHNLDGVTNLDITQGDQEASVEKFTGKLNTLTTDRVYTLDEIFTYIEDCGVKVIDGAVNVTITNLDENGNVIATFERGEYWNEGTISFKNTGTIAITIQDYYFCNATTVNATVTARVAEEKFNVVMNNGDFLHRVGNSGTVALSKLFAAKDGTNIGAVSVTIKAVDGTSASGTYTPATDWTAGTIQFSGTGVVKVTIKDDDTYCTPTELYLEVIDAVNATTATNATTNNIVLLNDAGFSSLEVSNGYALYGNGFTLTCSTDSYAIDRSYGFVVLENGTLDNVQIVAPNFSHAILYDSNKTEDKGNVAPVTDSNGRTRYYNIRSAVVMSGNSKITNSYVHGGRAAVYATSGNPVIENSTISGGAAANIHVEPNNNMTLKNVTMIQKPIQANVNTTDNTVMGMSVVVICDTDGNGAAITLEGTMRQYAWACEDYAEYVPSDAQDLITEALNQKEFVHEITYADGKARDSVNLGFAYLPASALSYSYQNVTDNRDDKETVPYDTASVNSGRVQIYTYKSTSGTSTDVQTEPVYSPDTQGAVLPTVNYADTNENRVFTTEYSDGWKATLSVNLDAGDYFFSFDNLLVQKYGADLSYEVTYADGTVVDTSQTITLSSSATTEFVLTITDDKIYDANGNLSDKVATHTYKFAIVATKTSINPPEINTDSVGTVLTVGEKGTSTTWNIAIPALTNIKVTYWNGSEYTTKTLAELCDVSSLSGTQTTTGENNNIWTYTGSNFTLSITGGLGKTNYYTKPCVVSKTLYFVVDNSEGLCSTSTTSRSITLTYTFTDSNQQSTTATATWEHTYNSDDKMYDHSKFLNGTQEEASGGCFTPDTLITLADGTQKRVDELELTDKILAWDFFTGTYVEQDIAFLVNHGEALYDIANLQFSDGSGISIIAEHGIFDYDLNKFVYISVDNMSEYIGHRFVKYSNDGSYDIVTLTNAYATEEYTTAWSITSTYTSNAFASGLLTVGPPDDFYNWIEMDGKLHYDNEQFAKDVETYGLYTYDDFKDYITYDQFVTWNGAYLKIAVEKGYFTFEYILELIGMYGEWMI